MAVTKNRRNAQRFEIPAGTEARVRFEYPPTGKSHELRLVDVSMSSICFACADRLPDLEAGSDIPDAVIRVGRTEMHGDLVVMHVTQKSSETHCGAMFYPATDADLGRLKETVAGVEAKQPV